MAPPDFPAGGYAADYAGLWIAWAAIVGGAVLFFRRTKGRSRLRLVAGNALVLVALLASAAVAGETYFRYVYDATDGFGLTLTTWSWYRRHVHLNSRGFRDREWTSSSAPHAARVACVGDSFTQGWGVRDAADCWPQRVGAELDVRFPGKFEVRNYGDAGFSTGDEARLIDRALRVDRVERVVLGYCLNDLDDLLPPGTLFDRRAVPPPPLVGRTRSLLVDFLWARLHVARDPRLADGFRLVQRAYDDAPIWERQRARLRHVADACRANSARLDVVVFPFLHDWGDAYSFDSCHERVIEAWRALGVEPIDLRAAYRGIARDDLVASKTDAHPNARAHEIAARAVLDRAFGVR
jgi:lysophospholipase L1-like esterase